MIDYSALAAAGGIPKHRPRVLEIHDKSTAHTRKLAKAYDLVNKRENNICQVSRVTLRPFSVNEKIRREHHHLSSRNVKPEWVYSAKRIILVSRTIHRLLTANVILIEGTDATKTLKFRWNRNMVKPGAEPMRLPRVA